jgi:hypothetical protein
MAEGKKSVLLYCDLIHTIEKMDDETAGKFFKHYLRYINDLNPVAENIIIDLTFEPVKQNLKRDLSKWESRADKSRNNGKLGGRPKKEETQKTKQVISEPKKPVKVTVNVNDNVNVKDKVSNSLMSEIEISDVPQNEIDYFNVANAFFQLFQQNAIDLDVRWVHLDKLTYKRCVTPIRLLATSDNRTRDEMLLVFDLLKKDLFWKQNIQSTEKLREKFDQLITKAQNYGKTDKRVTNEPYDLSCFDD